MARADSTVRVNIVGDAKSASKAFATAEKDAGGFGRSMKIIGGSIAAAFTVDAVFDFGQSAIAEADRVGDATTRLQEQLGDLSAPIIAASESMHELGLSEGDLLELSARISDMGTAAGIADDKLAPMALSTAETAAALSLISDTDAATIVDQIGKAANGSDRPLKDLGINLTDAEVAARAMRDTGKGSAEALTDNELAAARLAVILEKLAPRVAEVTGAEADLETRQRTLQAKFETLTGKIGDAVDGPLNDFLGWVLTGIDGLDLLGQRVDQFARHLSQAMPELRTAVGVLQTLVGLIQNAGSGGVGLGMGLVAPRGSSIPSNHAPHPGVTVQVQGGSPEEIERAVLNAVRIARMKGME